MLYFESSKNRNILAMLFTCFALLECIFFGYALEELYGVLYPSILHILTVFIIACLCYFLDFDRKLNAVFIFGAVLLESIFISLSSLYFQIGAEEAFYSIPSSKYLLLLFKLFSIHSIIIIFDNFINRKIKDKDAIHYIVSALLFSLYLIIGEGFGILYSSLVFVTFVFARIFVNNMTGQNGSYSKQIKITYLLSLLIYTVVLFSYKSGLLLIAEPCSFVILIIMWGGFIAFIFKKIYGLYLCGFLALHLFIAYVLSYINHAIDKDLLFGVLPTMLVFLIMFFVERKINVD